MNSNEKACHPIGFVVRSPRAIALTTADVKSTCVGLLRLFSDSIVLLIDLNSCLCPGSPGVLPALKTRIGWAARERRGRLSGRADAMGELCRVNQGPVCRQEAGELQHDGALMGSPTRHAWVWHHCEGGGVGRAGEAAPRVYLASRRATCSRSPRCLRRRWEAAL